VKAFKHTNTNHIAAEAYSRSSQMFILNTYKDLCCIFIGQNERV